MIYMMSAAESFSLDAANQAQRAANAADTNFKGIYALLQMVNNMDKGISEMRDWERERFNCVVDYVKDNNQKITALQEQVAALQKRLYEQEKRNKDITNACPECNGETL